MLFHVRGIKCLFIYLSMCCFIGLKKTLSVGHKTKSQWNLCTLLRMFELLGAVFFDLYGGIDLTLHKLIYRNFMFLV